MKEKIVFSLINFRENLLKIKDTCNLYKNMKLMNDIIKNILKELRKFLFY